MNILLNLLFAVVAFLVSRYLLALVGLDELIGLLLSIVIAIIVYLQNWAAKIER